MQYKITDSIPRIVEYFRNSENIDLYLLLESSTKTGISEFNKRLLENPRMEINEKRLADVIVLTETFDFDSKKDFAWLLMHICSTRSLSICLNNLILIFLLDIIPVFKVSDRTLIVNVLHFISSNEVFKINTISIEEKFEALKSEEYDENTIEGLILLEEKFQYSQKYNKNYLL